MPSEADDIDDMALIDRIAEAAALGEEVYVFAPHLAKEGDWCRISIS
ncbi:MAG: hypothetical protein WBB00_07450 [Mycobacterium sp.]